MGSGALECSDLKCPLNSARYDRIVKKIPSNVSIARAVVVIDVLFSGWLNILSEAKIVTESLQTECSGHGYFYRSDSKSLKKTISRSFKPLWDFKPRVCLS